MGAESLRDVIMGPPHRGRVGWGPESTGDVIGLPSGRSRWGSNHYRDGCGSLPRGRVGVGLSDSECSANAVDVVENVVIPESQCLMPQARFATLWRSDAMPATSLCCPPSSSIASRRSMQ